MAHVFGLLCHYFFVISKKAQFSMESYISLTFSPASWLLSIIMNIQPWVLFLAPLPSLRGWVLLCFITWWYYFCLFLFCFCFFPFPVNTWMLSTGTVFYYMYMSVLTSGVFVEHIHAMPPQEGIGSPGTWNALWLLGNKPRSSGRGSDVLTVEPSFQPLPLSFYFISFLF